MAKHRFEKCLSNIWMQYLNHWVPHNNIPGNHFIRRTPGVRSLTKDDYCNTAKAKTEGWKGIVEHLPFIGTEILHFIEFSDKKSISQHKEQTTNEEGNTMWTEAEMWVCTEAVCHLCEAAVPEWHSC